MFIKNTLHPEYTFYINTDDKIFEKNKRVLIQRRVRSKRHLPGFEDLCKFKTTEGRIDRFNFVTLNLYFYVSSPNYINLKQNAFHL